MRRGVNADKLHKLQLLNAISQRRKEQEQGALAKRRIIGLSDSDDDDDDYQDEELSPRLKAGYPMEPQPPASLNRLRKAGDREHHTQRPSQPTSISRSVSLEEDDLLGRLGGLSLGASGSGRSGSSVSAAAPSEGADQPAEPKAPSGPVRSGASVVMDRPKNKGVSSFKSRDGGVSSTAAPQPAPPSAKPPPQPPRAPTEEGALVLGAGGECRLSAALHRKLYPHQVVGVKWLQGLYQVSSGGILADDMGLGKTMQVSAFLAGSISGGSLRRALVIAPKTLIAAWSKELNVCGLGAITHEYFGSQNERQMAMNRVVGSRTGGVLLTTYGMVQHNSEALATHNSHDSDEGPLWDVIIMDEGHKLKNPKMQLRGHVESLPVRVRLIITGTPIQNNLMEMHALFDLTCPGLLGDARTFKDQFERAITRGSDKHATVWERERGASTAAALRRTIAPYMLRREKKEVFGTGGTAPSPGDAGVPAANQLNSLGRALSPGSGQKSAFSGTSGASHPGALSRKNDFVVWLRLQPNQLRLYQAFLDSDSVKAVLNQTSSALAALTVLKKMCDHPALLSERAQQGIASGAQRAARRALGEGSSSEDDESDFESIDSESEDEGEGEDSGWGSEDGEWQPAKQTKHKADAAQRRAAKQARREKLRATRAADQARQSSGIADASWGPGDALPAGVWAAWAGSGSDPDVLNEMHNTGLEASCKTAFVLALLRNLVAEGHRTLVFSQSRVMLDILETGVRAEGWRLCRIDGSIASAAERQARVEAFQSDLGIPVFLLTSQVGGLGLTLTAADRVIIVDPAWNPSVDSQSVDRAYRIGQKKDVVVYRLISCGTVEDKIYRKQVFKGGLSRTGTEDGEQFRYFSAAELRDLFRLDPGEAMRSSTQRHLHALHAHQRHSTPQLDAHLDFLKTLQGFAGVSDHDLLYSTKEAEGPAAGPAAAAPASFNMTPSSKKNRPRIAGNPGGRVDGSQQQSGGNGGGTGSQGWTGCGDISAVFAKALSLGPGDNPEARPEGSGSFEHHAKIAALQAQLAKQQALLCNPVLVAGLADGGTKIKGRIAEIQATITQLQGAPPALSNRRHAAEPAPFVPPTQEVRAPPAPQLLPRPTAIAASDVADSSPDFEQPSDVTKQRVQPAATPPLSPFQRLKASLANIFTGKSPALEQGSALAPACTHADDSHAAAPEQQHSRSAVTIAPVCQSSVEEQQRLVLRRKKRELYDKALSLAAVEESGENSARAALLREEVEELNNEYQAVKAALQS